MTSRRTGHGPCCLIAEPPVDLSDAGWRLREWEGVSARWVKLRGLLPKACAGHRFG